MTATIPTTEQRGRRQRKRIATMCGKNFANGNQVLFMDPYLLYYPRENRNLCLSPTNGICANPDPALGQLQGQSRLYPDAMPASWTWSR